MATFSPRSLWFFCLQDLHHPLRNPSIFSLRHSCPFVKHVDTISAYFNALLNYFIRFQSLSQHVIRVNLSVTSAHHIDVMKWAWFDTWHTKKSQFEHSIIRMIVHPVEMQTLVDPKYGGRHDAHQCWCGYDQAPCCAEFFQEY